MREIRERAVINLTVCRKSQRESDDVIDERATLPYSSKAAPVSRVLGRHAEWLNESMDEHGIGRRKPTAYGRWEWSDGAGEIQGKRVVTGAGRS